jgi:hypothetical protein
LKTFLKKRNKNSIFISNQFCIFELYQFNTMDNIKQYVQENKERFLNELIELLKIPSVSADSAYAHDVVLTAEAVKESLEKAGCDFVELCETPGYPIVYGEKIIDKNLPTVLVYGHYDVQPALKSDGWATDPFTLVEDKEGRIQVERMKEHKRTEYFYYHHKKFNIIPDSDDFKMLVELIMNSKQSFHIDGRAGCGKTTLIKMLQLEMSKRNIMYKSLAPTNKACRLIDGETMHRFSAMANGKYIRETLKFYEYIFIDEVSMMSEMFYKFFIVLKRTRYVSEN